MTQETPSKPPGERLASYFENFFKTVVGISTLGASLTFSKILDFSDPNPPRFSNDFDISPKHVLNLLAISWLFFILALAFTTFFASGLSLWRPAAVKAFGTQDTKDRERVLWVASGVSAFLLALLVIAFLTLSLVVARFTGGVGWAAVAATSVVAAFGFGIIIWRSPLQWPAWMHPSIHRPMARKEQQFSDIGSRGGNVHEEDETYGYDIDDERVASPEQGQRYAHSPAPLQPRAKRTARINDPVPSPVTARTGGGYDTYGRSTSGDYRRSSAANNAVAALRHGSGVVSRAEAAAGGEGSGSYDYSRYSRASTVIPDAYEPGRYGSAGYVYDDGVREGLVMGRYDR